MAKAPQSGTSVCDCSTPQPSLAAILYPSLGTPLLIGAKQKKCSIFIAAATLHETLDRPGLCSASAAATVARHLRLIGMKGPKPKGTAQEAPGDKIDASAIRVWRVGRFAAGAIIHNQKGEAFATIAPRAVETYQALGFTGKNIYEVELDLTQWPAAPGSDGFKSFAWMVQPTPQQKKDFPTLCAAPWVHAQDLIVEAFLSRQVGDKYAQHQPANAAGTRRGKETCLVEYDVPQTAARHKSLVSNSAERLAAWHPVIRLSSERPLKLGHLSDVHVNVRHNALAKSPARVIEDPKFEQRPVGARVCNSFNALKALFDKMGAGRKTDTALLLTGDLIDFNRNIDPAQVPDGIGEQWKKFNVLNNINTPGLYPRGQDDMLAFSLVRYAYSELKMPVFMTSGNHEAYAVPYGISPRVNDWVAAMGVLEDTTPALGKGYGREREFTPTVTSFDPESGQEQEVSTTATVNWTVRPLMNNAKDLTIKDLDETYRDFDAASNWHNNKANEGIAADHNMTIYEATLAYGPTFAQSLTGNNYNAENFDWFHILFTPLQDALIALGVEPDRNSPASQLIVALGWGEGENYKNLTDVLDGSGTDRQGPGILPRATDSFSAAQLGLVAQAGACKRASGRASLAVASHFTIINYGGSLALSAPPQQVRFRPAGGPTGGVRAGFNQVNTGTCEINQDKYFDQFVCAEGGGSVPAEAAVDWHFSGHSHRSGVYTVAWHQGALGLKSIEVRSARDPGVQQLPKAPPRQHTRFIVSSSGGPVGVQNLNHELEGWTLRPPSGTQLDPVSGTIAQIKTLRASASAGAPVNEKPRLCVALDYLAVMSRASQGAPGDPLHFNSAELGERGGRVPLRLSRTMRRLECIEGVRVWVFEGGKDEEDRDIKQWHLLTPSFHTGREEVFVEFNAADMTLLTRSLNANGGKTLAQAFCEVLLKKPNVGADDWSADMDCTDPWMFPLHVWVQQPTKIGAFTAPSRMWHFMRPPGEKGEVPDWKFLAKNYEGKGYVPAEEAITGKKRKSR